MLVRYVFILYLNVSEISDVLYTETHSVVRCKRPTCLNVSHHLLGKH